MRDMMTLLQQEYLWPIARELFPREGEAFHDHHSFMVQYKQVGSTLSRHGEPLPLAAPCKRHRPPPPPLGSGRADTVTNRTPPAPPLAPLAPRPAPPRPADFCCAGPGPGARHAHRRLGRYCECLPGQVRLP